jgi:hypothetical protein
MAKVLQTQALASLAAALQVFAASQVAVGKAASSSEQSALQPQSDAGRCPRRKAGSEYGRVESIVPTCASIAPRHTHGRMQAMTGETQVGIVGGIPHRVDVIGSDTRGVRSSLGSTIFHN